MLRIAPMHAKWTLYVMNSYIEASEIFLPTLTADLSGVTSSGKFRTLFDPASQASFITERAFTTLGCKIIDPKVKVNISGFNETKSFITKTVEIQFHVSAGIERTFVAVVVPEIRARLGKNSHIEEIKDGFGEHGIVLADSGLGDDGIIDVLLGAKNARILPVQSCGFGCVTDS